MTPALMVLLAGGAAGAALARALRLPFWALSGSALGSCAVTLATGGATAAPRWWSILAQVLVGTAVGASIGPGVLRDFRTVLVPGLLVVIVIVSAGIGCGWAIAVTGPAAPAAAVLGMVPGGVGEMVAAASALETDSALVAGMHIVRLLVVLSTLPLLVRWARRWRRPDGADED